jgi:hypothetical protein
VSVRLRGDRLEVFNLMQQAAAVMRRQPDRETRDRLWAQATDDLTDAVLCEDTVALREAFTEVCRSDWMRDNVLHSRKAPPRLSLVTEDQFERHVREGGAA